MSTAMQQSATIDPIHHAARKAVQAGLSVLPPHEDGTKRPRTVNGTWDQFKTAPPSADVLRGFYPGSAGLGIIAGQASHGVVCWDFDDRDTYLAFREAAEATGLFGLIERIENGYADDTPGGGVRWLVRLPPDTARDSNCKLARRPKRPEERRHEHDAVKVLIELPDYAIVAPTAGVVHPSGQPYRRRSGDFDTITSITSDEWMALLELARSFDEMPRDPAPVSAPHTSTAADSGRPGDVYTARTTWPDVLEPHGWRVVHRHGDKTYWRRPGKDFGSSATTNHGGSDLLYVFSTSTPFEAPRSYDRFGAYAVLKHGGDFAAAARALAAQGYGTAERPARAPRTAAVAPADAPDGVSLEDFHAYMPAHQYIFAPSRELWPASSVNARIPPQPLVDATGNPALDAKGQPRFILGNTWLDQYRPVEQMTWLPGLPALVPDRLVSEGGWIERPGCTTFNLYRPPCTLTGRADEAGRWLDHVRRVYPEDAAHILAWLAHRVQRPQEKINHALVLGGLQGVGKDTILEPVKQAIGPWNFTDVTPTHLLGQFNGFVKSVILRVNEARDLGDLDRYSFYDHLKIYTAAPPDALRVNEKHLREYAVWNVCGVVITTNHKADGLYLPADDRRHYVAWSDLTKDDFTPAYWTALYDWYAHEGNGHVAAYLAAYDLSGFQPKAPPLKTAAFWAIVDSNRAPEDAELADALDRLRDEDEQLPAALTLSDISAKATPDFAEWLRDRKQARKIPYRLEAAGYSAVRNPATKDGLWVVRSKRQAIYARRDLPTRDRISAAERLAG
jgi:hypothetical protein